MRIESRALCFFAASDRCLCSRARAVRVFLRIPAASGPHASLTRRRCYRTARCLVAGGNDGANALASAELYDPASGSWTATGSLADARERHTATLLPNGKVLVEGFVTSAELYDPASGTWTATGSLTTRGSETATLLPNGKVLVTVTVSEPFGATPTRAELYDPASGTWTTTGSLTTKRFEHTATLLPNGKVLVAGGYLTTGAPPVIVLETAELYDPASGTWTATGSLTTARYGHTATLLPNGKVLVAGGKDFNFQLWFASAELYDPTSGTWTTTGSLAAAREGHTATLLPNGKVLVVGGSDSGGALAGAELYDPASGAWAATGSLGASRQLQTATLLPGGKVLVAGGSDGSASLASVELYVGPPTPPTLLNISTRMQVLTDDKVLIGGFIITGTDLKRVLIRGLGPSLNGVDALSDPTLELHQGSVTLSTNDNWQMRPDGTSQQADIEATTIPPTNDTESAILTMLSPGAYTAILAGNDGGTGVGLVEVYDLGQGANSQPANISTRGFVDTGNNVMIGGLIVGGGSSGGSARVIVRAIGPSLPVTGALTDPTLELHDGDGALTASNDNWRSDQEAEIIATGIPPSNDVESAIVRDLTPGNYTAIVRGVNDTIGVALVEVYELN